KQSRAAWHCPGLLRCARNDGGGESGTTRPRPHRAIRRVSWTSKSTSKNPGDAATDWADLAQAALEALVTLAPELDNERLTTSLLFTSDAEVHVLNREWRARTSRPTCSRSPCWSARALLDLDEDGPPEMLGDLALACETCTREAAEKGIPVEHHATHLIIHGLLHLAGHDHETSDEDAEAMEALETKALAVLGIPDPYGDRTAATGI
ncbi:rRNA maturation RNase YbeY, partial [Novosphingobium resinovorum]|uniref:rRNA maturation RNase YbeY n=1 Tax=Novosphingobium resinovorum TaxID=158500 RepID=UPI003D2CD874